MKRAIFILAREFKDYFISPIAYIVIGIFLLITGWLFFTTFFLFGQADLRQFFDLLPVVFSFFVPAVTMRLFAEEFNLGSYEILLTMPVTFQDIILGKFLAGAFMVTAMLAPTICYPLSVSLLGELDWGPVIGGYLGALLLGASFVSVGLFASSLTRNQTIAFVVGMLICLSLTLIDKMLFFFPETWLGVVGYLGADFHFQNIAKGVIDSRDILFFLSIIFVGLYATYLSVAEKV